MQTTKVSVKGVYKVIAPDEAYRDAMSARGDEEYVNSELSSLVLVEIEIDGADHRFDLSEFKQPHTEYVPYAETFFDIESGKIIKPDRSHLGFSVFTDENGHSMKYVTATNETQEVTNEELENYRLPGTRDFIVVFFLHFFDQAQPLRTPYGSLSLPAVSPLPHRLRWKEYIYWC